MKILALETSTLMGSAALIVDGKVVAEKSSLRQKSHSEILNSFIEEILQSAKIKLSEIDGFAVGQGPGSFTGIRIAGNIAKTLAYSYGKPMVTFDSLVLLASPAPRDLPVISIINAYKNMVYYGIFKSQPGAPQYLKGPGVVPVKSLGSVLTETCLVVGDGYSAYKPYFPPELAALMVRDNSVPDEPLASTLGLLAYPRFQSGLTLDWKSFVPLYIRGLRSRRK